MKNEPKSPTPPRGVLSEILYLKPEDLKPSPNNPRTHNERQLTALEASLRRFGATVPLIIDENNTILAGHGRWQVSKRLNLLSIPVRRLSGLTPAEKLGYLIADNKIADLSEWDQDLLKLDLSILLEQDFEVELTAFSTAEIDLLLDSESKGSGSKVDPADLQASDLAVAVVSRPGDLWQLGDHRLLCGDALITGDYDRLMRGDLAQMVFADVPFNVSVAGHVGGLGKIKHREFAMASGEMSRPEYTQFLGTALVNMQSFCGDGALIFVCQDWRHIGELLAASEPLFSDPKQMCVWVKASGAMGTFYRSRHELVFIFKNGAAAHINNFELGQFGRYRTNVWEYGRESKHLALHPTVKPLSMVADALRDCSHRKGIVLDPFAGSGTILVAAERTGRIARAIEYDPHYVDVAVARWQRVTGEQAVLAETRQTWTEVQAARQGERMPSASQDADAVESSPVSMSEDRS